MTWPVGISGDFRGVIDRRDGGFTRFTRTVRGSAIAPEEEVDAERAESEEGAAWSAAVDEIGLLEAVDASHDQETFLAGMTSPVFVGSALTNFGVRHLLDAVIDLAPAPSARIDVGGEPRPLESDCSAFVFKVQANMDRAHRDRIAFIRVCSGVFERGMVLTCERTGKPFATKYASQVFGAERTTVDEAYPGDVVGLVNATSGSVVLINPIDGFLEIQAAHGLSAGAKLKLRVGEGITGWVAQQGKSAIVPDVSADKRYVPVHEHTRSELAVPLEINGVLSGVVNVDSAKPSAFDENDLALLTELASQAALVIHNAFLYEKSLIRANLFESLITVGQAINSAVDLDEALAAITREAASLMNAKTCALQLLDESSSHLTLVASHGAGEAYLNKPGVDIAESFLGSVVNLKKPLQIENVQTSNAYQQQDIAREEGLEAHALAAEYRLQG